MSQPTTTQPRSFRFDFSNLTPAQKDRILALTQDFLNEEDIHAVTEFLIEYAWESGANKVPCEPAPFRLRNNLQVLLRGIEVEV